MGFIKSGVVIFLGAILFLSLFLGNVFLTLSWSLEYETVSPNLGVFADSVVDDFGVREVLNSDYGLMDIYCIGYSSYTVSRENFTLEIPCNVVELGLDEVVNYGVDSFLYQIYYKDYDCSFWECLKTENKPYILVSNEARIYWKSLFYWTVLIACIIFLLLFLFTDSKNSPLIIIGVLMIVASLPFRKLNWAMSFLPDSSLFDLATVFFSSSYNVFVNMIVIGIVLFAIGIAFHFFGWGMKFSNFISKLVKKKEKKEGVGLGEGKEKETFTKDEVKDLVKEEVEKSKKKESLRKHVKDLVREELDKVRGKKD